MSVRKSFALLVILMLAAGLLAACGGGTTSGGSGGNATAVSLTGSDDLKWNPTSITVKAGTAVAVSLVNNGKVDHDFSVPDLKVSVPMPAGKTTPANFTAPAAGTYQFICTVPGHKEAGMVGQLVVQ